MKKEKNVADGTNEIQRQEDNPLSLVINSDMRDGMIFKTACRLCNSLVRKDAEKMFDDGKPISQIKAFLDEKGEPLGLSNINNHFKEHHKSLERKAILAEYCADLNAMRQRVRGKFSDVQCTIDVGFKELARAISHPTGGDLGKEESRFDMVMKATRMIREGVAQLHEMDSAEAKVKVVHMQLLKVWKAAIAGAPTDAERQVYIQMFNKFKDLVSVIEPEEPPK